MNGYPRPHELSPPTVEQILRATSRAWDVPIDDIKSRRRPAELVRPRHAAIAMARILVGLSHTGIGRRIGGRDHTTIGHALRKTEVVAAVRRALAEVGTGPLDLDAMAERVRHMLEGVE